MAPSFPLSPCSTSLCKAKNNCREQCHHARVRPQSSPRDRTQPPEDPSHVLKRGPKLEKERFSRMPVSRVTTAVASFSCSLSHTLPEPGRSSALSGTCRGPCGPPPPLGPAWPPPEPPAPEGDRGLGGFRGDRPGGLEAAGSHRWRSHQEALKGRGRTGTELTLHAASCTSVLESSMWMTTPCAR